jgi:energy-coupling factor transporter ATP-binding protein EcfA2
VDTDHSVDSMIRLIRRYLVPRLADRPLPLVVAVVGSTGAGKSTLVNSVAGAPVTRAGVLRPTTNEPVVWTGPAHSGLEWPGEVIVGDHPLAARLALIDTPDLDSDVVEHRRRAVDTMEAADAIVFVTTPSRYGDESPWEVLRSTAGKPLVVVVNRLQARASGARNDLSARLRAEGMGSVPVLTISEQHVAPGRGRLSSQSVQRLSHVLREWTSHIEEIRLEALDHAADGLASRLAMLLPALEEQAARATSAAKEVEAIYETAIAAVESVAVPARRVRWRWRPIRRRSDIRLRAARVVEAVDQAASVAAAVLAGEGMQVEPELATTSRPTVQELSRLMALREAPDRDVIRRLLDDERRRYLDRLSLPPDGVLERLQHGARLLGDLDLRSV